MKILIVDCPTLLSELLVSELSSNNEFITISTCKIDEIHEEVVSKEIDIILIYSSSFSWQAKEYALRSRIIPILTNKYYRKYAIIILGDNDNNFAKRVLKYSLIKGFVTQDMSLSELILAFEEVYKGRYYIKDNIRQDFLTEYIQASIVEDYFKDLTKREIEAIKHIASGLTAAETADIMCISPYTVKNHKRRIFEKLGLRSSVELTKLAVEKGII